MPDKIISSSVNRNKYIGGSDAGALYGRNKYRTILDVYETKRNDLSTELEPNGHIRRGNFMEPTIEEWVKEHLDPGLNSGEYFEQFDARPGEGYQIMLFDDEQPYLGGHPDGIGDMGLWEFKAPTMYTVDRIKRNGPPKRYLAQIHHYLLITGLDMGRLAVWDYNSWEPVIYMVPARPKAYEQMRKDYADFWQRVQDGNPPTDHYQSDLLFKKLDDPLVEDLAADYKEAKTLRYAAKDAESEAKGKLLAQLPAEGGRFVTPHFVIDANKVSPKNRASYFKLNVSERN